MLALISRFFCSPAPDTPPSAHDLRVAACVLLVELARADGDFSAEEVQQILALLQAQHQLSEEEAEALLAEARAQSQESIDLWQFTRRLNDHCSTDEKLDIVEMLWRVVYADGRVDDHEHYLMGKLTRLLNLDHEQVFACKQRARAG